MKRLGDMSRAYLRHRLSRTLLTGSAVTLGVAMLFGVLVSNASVEEGFDARRREFAGLADAEVFPIGAWGSRLPPDVVDRVLALPGVTDATASMGVAATSLDGTTLTLSGFDEKAHVIGQWQFADGRAPAPGADEVVHTVGKGPGLGGTVAVRGPTGDYQLTVVGLLAERGIGEIRDGTIHITSLATAQRIAGEPGAVEGVRAVLDDGVDRVAWLADNQLAVEGARIEDAQGGFFGGGDIRQALVIVSAVTLFVAGFLIYMTLSGAIVERTAVYGTMRALGASRRQVSRVVLREALSLGVVAAGLGLVLGVGVGELLNRQLSSAWDLPESSLTIPPGAVVTSVLVGLIVSAAAAWFPARRAGRLAPSVAMRGDVASRAEVGRAWIAGLVLAALGMAVMMTAPFPLSILGMLVLMLGAVLVVPPILGPLARVAGAVVSRTTRGLTNVSVMHLVKERSRSAYTLGLIMVVVAFGISLGSARASLGQLADRVVAEQFQAPITVLSPNPITPQTVELVRATNGVGAVSELRYGNSNVVIDGAEYWTNISVIDPATYFDVQGFAWSVGDDELARGELAQGGSVAITDTMANAFGLGVGDEIVLRTTSGPQPFTIFGLTTGFGGWEAFVGVADATQHFGAGPTLSLIAGVQPDANAETVRESLRSALGAGSTRDFGGADFNVVGPDTVRNQIQTEIDGILTVFFGVMLVALVAGLLGLANTLAISVIQRVREIGVTRALGASPGQVAAGVVTEAGVLAAAAYVLSVPLGLVLGLALNGSFDDIGFSAPSAGPGPAVLLLALVAVAACALAAGWFPSRRAANTVIVDALRVE